MAEKEKAAEAARTLQESGDTAKLVQSIETHKENDSMITDVFAGANKNGNAIGLPRVLISPVMKKTKPQQWNPSNPTSIPPEDLREFPTWGLPEDLQRIIKGVADGYQCAPSIPTAAIFSAAGTAIGKSVTGKFDNYTTYPANWFVIVGKASSGKTGAADWIYKPLMDYEEKAYHDYLDAKAAYNLKTNVETRPGCTPGLRG